MLKIPSPRLLPSTIAAMTALLLLKSGILVHAAATDGAKPESVIVAAAYAASTEQTRDPAKPPAANPAPAAPQKAAAQEGKEPGKTPPVPDSPPPVTASEKALLQDLRQRRQDLDKRADTIATRESVLAATEQKLTELVNELQALQKKLELTDAAQKQKEDAGWQGLVKLYEAMKPKDAATIFNDLAMPVLLQIMDRMKDAKAASVMAAMNPDKARDVTGELAQLRTGRDTSASPVAGLKGNVSGG
jgi:flagellar motility protein MotE (MotC chaperone)